MVNKLGKKTALATGFGTVAVLGLAFVFWKEILVQYHLYRLRKEPETLLKLIEKPEGTVEAKAVRLFAGTEEGLHVLSAAYAKGLLSHLERALALSNGLPFPTGQNSIFLLSLYETNEQWRAFGLGMDSIYCGTRIDEPGRGPLVAIYQLLRSVGVRRSREFTLSTYPGLVFCVLPGDKAFLASGLGTPFLRRASETSADLTQVPMADEIMCLAKLPDSWCPKVDLSPCVIPLLFQALSGLDEDVQFLAMQVLGDLDINLEDPIPGLIDMLRDENGFCSPESSFRGVRPT